MTHSVVESGKSECHAKFLLDKIIDLNCIVFGGPRGPVNTVFLLVLLVPIG